MIDKELQQHGSVRSGRCLSLFVSVIFLTMTYSNEELQNFPVSSECIVFIKIILFKKYLLFQRHIEKGKTCQISIHGGFFQNIISLESSSVRNQGYKGC